MENLIDSSLEIAGAIYSYAHDEKNNELMARVDLKPTYFEKMTQAEIISVAGIIMEAASKLSPEALANEDISAEEISTYAKLISFFKAIKSSKREAVIDRSGTTEKLNQLFEEANALIKEKLDRLARQFKRKDPDFFLKYKAARTVLYRNASKKEAEVGGAKS